MRKIYQILCPSNVTKICCQQLFVLLSWNYDFSTIFPFTESTHICALYMVQTLCNMKCRFCVLKIEISPKSSVIFKIHKNCRCSDLTFWLGLDFIIKIHYCTSSEHQILEDIREKDGRRIISWILKILHHESLQAKGNLLYVSCSNSSKKERKVYRESFFSALSWVNDPC